MEFYISKRSGMDHTVLSANTPCLPFLLDSSHSVWSFHLGDISPTTWTVCLQSGHFANKTARI